MNWSPSVILAVVAGGLCVIALFPSARTWPLVAVAGLLLAVAIIVQGK